MLIRPIYSKDEYATFKKAHEILVESKPKYRTSTHDRMILLGLVLDHYEQQKGIEKAPPKPGTCQHQLPKTQYCKECWLDGYNTPEEKR